MNYEVKGVASNNCSHFNTNWKSIYDFIIAFVFLEFIRAIRKRSYIQAE